MRTEEHRYGKVCFRKVREDDLALRAQWLNDPAVQNTLSYEMPVTLEKTRAWFERNKDRQDRLDFSVFTVEGTYIGFCGFLGIERDVGRAEHYITIGHNDYRGKGYGRDTYILLQEVFFEVLGLNRLYGYQLTNNVAGHRLVQKLGWTREGHLRQDKLSHGKIVDRYVIAMLREDWLLVKDSYGQG